MSMTALRLALAVLSLSSASSYSLPTPRGLVGTRRSRCAVFAQQADDEPPDGYIPPIDGVAPPDPEPLPGNPRRFSEGTGPFSTSHGVPMTEEEEGLNYMTAKDWHVSASYTKEQRAQAIEADEQVVAAAAGLAAVEKEEETKEEAIAASQAFFAPKPYMETDEGDLPPDRPEPWDAAPPKVPMPTSWQEYQFLQAQVATYAAEQTDLAQPVPAKDRAEAEDLTRKLGEVYPVFKTILAEGWEFDYDPDVEAAGLFIVRMKQWEKKTTPAGAKKKAVVELEA